MPIDLPPLHNQERQYVNVLRKVDDVQRNTDKAAAEPSDIVVPLAYQGHHEPSEIKSRISEAVDNGDLIEIEESVFRYVLSDDVAESDLQFPRK